MKQRATSDGTINLIGKIVAVHPDTTTDPTDMRGEVGRVFYNSDEEIVVSFPDDIKGRYSPDVLLTLASYDNIIRQLHTLYDELSDADRRTILQITKLKADGKERQALTLAMINRSIMFRVTEYCSETIQTLKETAGKKPGLRR